MKLFRMLGRSIRDAVKSVIRNFSLSLASISCITITLIIVAIAIMASYNVQNFTKEIERDMTIVAFLDNDATKSDVKEIEKEINSISNVDKYTYQSKQEVKEKMQAESDVFDTVLQNWSDEESPLKDTIQVKVKDVEKINKTAAKIESIDKVAVVRYGSGMVDKMIAAFNQVEKITYGIVIALIVVTVFLIINTIKTPFIIEGMILGIFGSIVPVLITMYGYTAFYNHFDGYLYSQLIKLIQPEPFIYQVSLSVIIIGIIVGMIGSSSAVRKYLKV